jgi:maltokinase
VLTGEQSNTSIVLSAGSVPVGILKVLRSPASGDNPDVDVPRRLVEVGWDAVPAPLGWLEASWPDASGAPVRGHLGVLSAFVPGAADGFELACSYARRSAGFSELAGELGAVVASMHAALVRAFGTWPVEGSTSLPAVAGPPGSGAAEVARAIEERFAWARDALPSLSDYEDGVRRVVAQVVALPSVPARQRVHGDLHLGQVLRSGGRWFVTDFEGEPLAPLDERVRPDLAVRDLAGVLRSFDYAAAVGGLDAEAARPWILGCRAAFLDGYLARASAGGRTGVLLRALELDKALYEAVYEARNRPSWLHIPLAGLDRLVAD